MRITFRECFPPQLLKAGPRRSQVRARGAASGSRWPSWAARPCGLCGRKAAFNSKTERQSQKTEGEKLRRREQEGKDAPSASRTGVGGWDLGQGGGWVGWGWMRWGGGVAIETCRLHNGTFPHLIGPEAALIGVCGTHQSAGDDDKDVPEFSPAPAPVRPCLTPDPSLQLPPPPPPHTHSCPG